LPNSESDKQQQTGERQVRVEAGKSGSDRTGSDKASAGSRFEEVFDEQKGSRL
jgi:hypothetical protein